MKWNSAKGLGLALTIVVLFVVGFFIWFLALWGPVLGRIRITNVTGQDVTVTSDDSKRSALLRDGKTAFIHHDLGDIIVKTHDGKVWNFKDISPFDLDEPTFVTYKKYVLSFPFRHLWTASLLLDEDGLLYVVPTGTRDEDAGKAKQPEGYPRAPESTKGPEQPRGDM